MATVIDQLIVTLGLDPAQFKKGTNEATKQVKLTQEQFRKSGEAMTRSIVDVARNIFVAFVGFESVSGLINFLGRLNQAQASLSRMAQNFGTSARALDVWDKKVELAGGTVAGAQSSINQLNQDITALYTRGETSPLLVFFQQLGIDIKGVWTGAKSAQTAFEELFAAMGKRPREQMFRLGTQAGISPDVLTYGLRPLSERQALTKEAERLSRATDANTKAADNLRERWVAIRDSLENIGVALLEKITPTIERLLPVVERLALRFGDFIAGFKDTDPKDFFKAIDEGATALLDKVKAIRTEIGKILAGDFSDVIEAVKQNIAENLNTPSQAWSQGWEHDPFFGAQPDSLWSTIKRWLGLTGGAPYMQTFRESGERHHLPPGLLESIADRESSFDPNKISAKGAVGIMQLMPGLFPGAGKDPKRDIEMAAAELERLNAHYHDWARSVMAYNEGQGTLDKGRVYSETRAYVQSVGADMHRLRAGTPPSQRGPVNNIQIDNVVINTQATDGKQVGIDFMAEMKKRNLVLQSDTGIVP